MIDDRPDIRWKQQFASFCRAEGFLDAAAAIDKPSDIKRMGLFQAFEVTVECGWKTLREYIKERGQSERFPKDVIRSAFQFGLPADAEIWLKAIDRRNATSHTYDHASLSCH